jgi:hypothetical protein
MFFTFPEDSSLGCRAAGGGVWGRDRRIPRRGPGSRGACSSAYCPNGRHRRSALKRTTFSDRGSRASLRGSCGLDLRMGAGPAPKSEASFRLWSRQRR